VLAGTRSVSPRSERLLPAFSSFCFLPLALPPESFAITRLLWSLQQNQHDASETSWGKVASCKPQHSNYGVSTDVGEEWVPHSLPSVLQRWTVTTSWGWRGEVASCMITALSYVNRRQSLTYLWGLSLKYFTDSWGNECHDAIGKCYMSVFNPRSVNDAANAQRVWSSPLLDDVQSTM